MRLRNCTILSVTVLGVGVLAVLTTAVYLSPHVDSGARRLLVTDTTANGSAALTVELEILDQYPTSSKSVTKAHVNLAEQTNGTHVHGYLLARYYDQQMTAGVMDFFKLSNIAFRLKLSTIEPFVQGSHLIGIPDITSKHGDHRFWDLSKFYDVNA